MAPVRIDTSLLSGSVPSPISAKDSRGRDIEFEDRPIEPIPDWALTLIDAHNRSADAIDDLNRIGGTERRVLKLLTVDPIEDTFPIFLATKHPPGGILCSWPRNLDDQTALFYEAVTVDFIRTKGGAMIRYITGLAPGVRYQLNLEILR